MKARSAFSVGQLFFLETENPSTFRFFLTFSPLCAKEKFTGTKVFISKDEAETIVFTWFSQVEKTHRVINRWRGVVGIIGDFRERRFQRLWQGVKLRRIAEFFGRNQSESRAPR